MFSSAPHYAKLKTNLRLVINRLKLLEKKKSETNLKARRDIAQYLQDHKPDRARIRVESIIREDFLVEALELIEMYADLCLSRFGLIETQKYGYVLSHCRIFCTYSQLSGLIESFIQLCALLWKWTFFIFEHDAIANWFTLELFSFLQCHVLRWLWLILTSLASARHPALFCIALMSFVSCLLFRESDILVVCSLLVCVWIIVVSLRELLSERIVGWGPLAE